MSQQTESREEEIIPVPKELAQAIDDLCESLIDDENNCGITILITQESVTRSYHFSNTEKNLTEHFLGVQIRALQALAEEIQKNYIPEPNITPIYFGKAGEA